MTRLRIGVVGVGHLGKEHARILSGFRDVELVGVADVNAEQAATVALRCDTRALADHRALLPLVDAAVIATPTVHHHAVAVDFLRQGIPVLVEKPLAATPTEAQDLVAHATRHGLVLQVGHVERFNPAFESLLARPFRPKFISGHRFGLFTGRSPDIGAVLDLMIHDVDLVLALVKSPVRSVEAVGVSVLGEHEDMAHARLTFEEGCVADLAASRISLQPSRRMQLWGAEGYASIDFALRRLTLVQPNEALVQHRSGVCPLDAATRKTLKEDLVGRLLEGVELDCNHGDQLTRELEEFVRCIRTGARPRVGGVEGLEAVELATRVLQSLREHRWEANERGPCGPFELPASTGMLFTPSAQSRAA
jgi:predicted dehydrogenase